MSFAEKVVWATGASSGIGEALARDMLDGGAMLVLSGRNADALARVAAIAPGRALVLPFESTDFDGLPRICRPRSARTCSMRSASRRAAALR